METTPSSRPAGLNGRFDVTFSSMGDKYAEDASLFDAAATIGFTPSAHHKEAS